MSSFAYSTPVSPSRSPLQRKFDDERKYKERIARITYKNNECQFRRKLLENTFKKTLEHEAKESLKSTKSGDQEQNSTNSVKSDEQKQNSTDSVKSDEQEQNNSSNLNESIEKEQLSINNISDDS